MDFQRKQNTQFVNFLHTKAWMDELCAHALAQMRHVLQRLDAATA